MCVLRPCVVFDYALGGLYRHKLELTRNVPTGGKCRINSQNNGGGLHVSGSCLLY